MKIGVYATGSGTSSHTDLLKQIEYADERGFDSAWLRERHFHPDHKGRNFFTSPLVAASYVAARTKHIRIGIASRILPLDHPIHIAEDGATVDVISNGRLDLGIARVGENELYELAFGVTTEEARGRFEECVEILLRAWTLPQFSYDGTYYSIPDVSVYPKPVQKPHPPIYVVGISSETFKFGANRGFPLILAGAQPVSIVKRTQQEYHQLLADHRFPAREIELPVNRFLYVAESNQQAIDETRDALNAFIHRGATAIRDYLFRAQEEITPEWLYEEVCIFGDPDTCIKKINALKQELDLRHIICTFNYYTIDHDRCQKSMERFVKYVMPHIR